MMFVVLKIAIPPNQPMAFQLISDVHLEFQKDFKPFFKNLKKSADNLIIAGDFIAFKDERLFEAFEIVCKKFKNIIYVLGNHEYYGSTIKEVEILCKELSKTFKNLHILNNNIIEIDSVRVGGTTLWFPDNPSNLSYEPMLSDFLAIKTSRVWFYEENIKAIDFIKKNDMDILITHHLPSEKSTPERFKGSNLNRFFVCDIEDILLEKNIKVVCHGHTHDSCDYNLGNYTRIICNPYGYEDYAVNPNFKNNLIF